MMVSGRSVSCESAAQATSSSPGNSKVSRPRAPTATATSQSPRPHPMLTSHGCTEGDGPFENGSSQGTTANTKPASRRTSKGRGMRAMSPCR